MKVGQHPHQPSEVPPELRRYLGSHEEFYKRGRLSELSGFGIGAVAYYRRMVEMTIDALLSDIADVFASDDAKSEYMRALDDVKKTTVHAKKIQIVKDLVPDVLKRGQNNPLGFLHSALSVGLHALSEDECLDMASEIRESIAIIVSHIELAREQDSHVSGSMARLQERLRKIAEKPSDSAPS